MQPRIILVGGWEFTKEDGIDEEIAKLANGKIVLIPNASTVPEKQIGRAISTYKKYETEVILLEEDTQEIPEDIKVVYLGGGDPKRLVSFFNKNSELWADIKNKLLKRKIVLVGTSAGAMVMFKEMLAADSYGKGNTNLSSGLGLIQNNAVVFPHWNEPNGLQEWRDRILVNHTNKLIIAIDEYTSLFWGDESAKVVGLGSVFLVENSEVQKYTNGQSILSFSLLL